MNITGSVILGLIYVLPGILFVVGFARVLSTKTPSPFDGQLSTGFILAIPAALLMHFVGIGSSHLLSWSWGTPKPDLHLALTLLLADSKSAEYATAIANVAKYWLAATIYFVALAIASPYIGRRISKKFQRHRAADWYELLRNRADVLWLTTEMQIGGVAYLFAGALKEFKVSGDGELERVVLVGAARRTLRRPTPEEMENGGETYQDGGWIAIPGEHVVLKMDSSRTVNVDYWYVEDDEAESSAISDAEEDQRTSRSGPTLPHCCNGDTPNTGSTKS